MRRSLVSAIADAAGLEFDAVDGNLARSRDISRGDFSFPCFVLAKQLKVAPQEYARSLCDKLVLPKEIARAEVVGPYINFFLDRAREAARVISSCLNKDFPVAPAELRGETVIIDYSHPNIAKPFHVGHLRTTLIGLSLYRLYKHLGYKVIGINHLGDWGTQFGFVYAGCVLWGRPDPAGVDELVDVYVRASALRRSQEEGTVALEDLDKPNVKDLARDYFKRLEAKEGEAVEFWQWCLDISLDYFQAIYRCLGIEFDFYHGESFYQDMLPKVEERLRESGVLEESRGALGVNLGKELGFARIFAEDGRSLYITRDIAAAFYREETFQPLRILYVVAMAQTLHFKQLKGVLARLEHSLADKITHISFGNVPGMKTRSGGAISLHGFLEEAHERALKAYRDEVARRPEELDEEAVAEAVAIGATYFYFLSHSNIKDFQFKWDEALTFQGDTGPYVQYAYARMCSIESKAAEAGISIQGAKSFDAGLLKEDDAYELVQLLCRFEDTVFQSAVDYEPYYLAQYALDLAKTVARCYKQLRVVGEDQDLAKARLALFTAARDVLGIAMRLLGMPAIGRM